MPHQFRMNAERGDVARENAPTGVKRTIRSPFRCCKNSAAHFKLSDAF